MSPSFGGDVGIDATVVWRLMYVRAREKYQRGRPDFIAHIGYTGQWVTSRPQPAEIVYTGARMSSFLRVSLFMLHNKAV